jgi:hypothetical protein
MRDRIRIRGQVTVRVLDENGNVKRHRPGLFRRLLRWPGRFMVSRHHNIVTREGDALIADALLASPKRKKVTYSSGFIQVGTGWTGNDTKTNTRCNTPVGEMRGLDEIFPVLAAEWGNTGDTTIIYRTTFHAGWLRHSGINEACLLNGSDTAANCLAYAEITPAVNVTGTDTLQVVWEITILGQ